MFAVLLTTTLAALVLGLARLSTDGTYLGMLVAQYLLMLLAFSVNCVVAVWGTLGVGAVASRIAGVLLVSVLLGITFSISINAQGDSSLALPWWLFAASSLVLVIPTLITVSTQLVFRRLGFRLTKKRTTSASVASG